MGRKGINYSLPVQTHHEYIKSEHSKICSDSIKIEKVIT